MALKDKILTDGGEGTEFEFPGTQFVVRIAPVSSRRRLEILRKCEIKPLPGSRVSTVEYDDEKFNRLWAREVIRGWRGLDEKTLMRLLVLDPGQKIEPEDTAYSPENAEVLMAESPAFNAWVTSVLRDAEVQNEALRAQSIKN